MGSKISAIVGLIFLGLFLFASDALAQEFEFLSSALWNTVRDGEVAGQYSYCAFKNGLVVLQNSPDTMILVSQLMLPGTGLGIHIKNESAYVADGSAGLYIVDISNPQNPIEIGHCPLPGSALDVYTDSIYAFVACDVAGLRIVDITNQSNPAVVDSFIGSAQCNDVAALAGYVHAAFDLDGIVSGRMNAQGHFEFLGSCPTIGKAVGIAAQDTIVCVAVDTAGMQIINVANAAQPIAVGRYDVQGFSTAVDAIGNRAILVSHYSFFEGPPWYGHISIDRLHAIDINDRSLPLHITQYEEQHSSYLIDPNIAYSCDLAFVNLALMPSTSSAIKYINFSSIDDPTIVARYTIPGTVSTLELDNSHVYCASRETYILNIENPLLPNFIGRTLSQGSDIDLSGCYAFLTYDGWAEFGDDYSLITSINIGIPSNPYYIGEIRLNDGRWASDIQGNYIYTVGSGRMDAISIEDPAHLILEGTHVFNQSPIDLKVRDAFAYLVWYIDGLMILNISSPSNMTFVGSCGGIRGAQAIELYGNYAVIARGDSGLAVIDISDPAAPFLVSSLDNGTALNLRISGHYAIVACGTDGVQLIDLADPTQLQIVDQYDTQGSAFNLDFEDEIAAICDESSLIFLRLPGVNAADDPGQIPFQIGLFRNYPNPFNSATSIEYSLAKPGPVMISIFDIGGRKIGAFSEDVRPAGISRQSWNAASLPSGIYIAHLESGNQSRTIKMLLIK